MHDVFISYAREDQALAQDLAQDLGARGYQVWWDSELVGSDDYYEVILTALANARAAIVIWTKHSVKSRFLRDEARFALHHEKLVAVKTPDLDIFDIPFGFQGQHTDEVSERDQIVRAIEKLGARPKVAEQAAAGIADTEAAAWAQVKDAGTINDLAGFIAAYPNSLHRQQALTRLQQLLAGGAPAGAKVVENPQRESKLSAFISGLTLRVPSFQTVGGAFVSAIGMILGYFIAAMILVLFGMSIEDYARGELGLERERSTDIAVTFIFGGLAIPLWRQFNRWIHQRSFIAASVISLLCIFFTMFFAYGFTKSIFFDAGDDLPTLALVIVLVSSIVYVVWRFRKAR